MNNFELISIISASSKVFELILKEKLSDFLKQTTHLKSTPKNSFQKNKSTVLAVFRRSILVNYSILEANNNGKITYISQTDLTKTFDCLNHQLLLHELQYYRIRGYSYNSLQSYLNKISSSSY